MSVLTAVLTHLPAAAARTQLHYLRTLSPQSRFVIAHGGRPADFHGLPAEDAVFVDDPSLRGPHFDQSINRTLRLVHERWVEPDPSIEWMYLAEYDHLILRGDFDVRLRELAERTGAGFLGKWCSRRNDSNWPHYVRYKHDRRLEQYVRELSVRDDPLERYGALGNGMLLSRAALSAFCSLPDPPDYYFELFVPTIIYHLGFRVVDIDEYSDLYVHLRWLPPYTVAEALACRERGATFVHPFKQIDQLPLIADALTSGVKTSVAETSG